MRLIGLSTRNDDDPDFIRLVQRLIHGVVQTKHPSEYCVVRIDDWFGEGWLDFSGKLLGALSVRRTKTTFPPFVPSRVESYSLFRWSASSNDYEIVEDPNWVHRRQHSDRNLFNFVSGQFPNAAFFWFSSKAKANGRGSFMCYLSEAGDCWTWYLELQKLQEWKPSKRVNITPGELGFYLSKCLGHTRGNCVSAPQPIV